MRKIHLFGRKPIIARAIFTTLAFLLLTGCGELGENVGPGVESGVESIQPGDSFSFPEGTTGNTVYIDAATGGVVSLPVEAGSVSLSIPPGALPSSMAISVYTLPEATPDRIHLAFEPTGLEFLEPVRLTVSLSDDLFTNSALINMWHISELNDPVDAGSEQHQWAPFTDVALDTGGRTISGEMRHFSTGFILLGIQRVAYLVLDLPGKYLRPGDGLFVMSEGWPKTDNFRYNWVPGHNGMVNSVHPDGAFPTTVIESTLDGGAAENIDGVQINDFLRFKRTAGHVYMGARRPRGPIFTDAERLAAVTFARSKLGAGYGPLGALGTGLWTCTDLLEGAWDAAGRGVVAIPTPQQKWLTLREAGLVLADAFFPSPVEMFEATVPVRDITVRVGEEVRIPVYPVVIDPAANVVLETGYYLAGNRDVTVTMTVAGLPQGATFSGEDNNHVYRARSVVWTPQPSDAGSTILLDFNMTGTVATNWSGTHTFNVTQTLDIHVLGDYAELDVLPAGRGTTGYTHYFDFAMPDGAVVGPASADHLIDKATGNYPVNPIFRDQVIDRFEEGWMNADSTHYGMSFHVSRLDNPFSAPPSGSHKWIYWIDYEVPFYTGQN
ncbi:MAG: hypothetical protein O7F70_00315 [Gemmatimonadetes bacterium]|nr:hypothetical protein [Gemmatimonadota bacterium]